MTHSSRLTDQPPLSAREEAENFKRWSYQQLAERDGFNLDVWADVEDKSFVDVENLPEPDVIAEEIVDSSKLSPISLGGRGRLVR